MVDNIAARLDAAIRAVVPIVSVAVGDPADRATWKVQPAALQSAAQPIIDAFVGPTAAQLLDEDAQRETTEKKLQAIVIALWECIPSPLMTKAQLKARAIAIYKGLP